MVGSFSPTERSLACGKSSEVLQIKGVGALDGQTEGTAPYLSRHDTEGTRDSEEDGVVIMLGKTVVHEEGTRAAIDIGPWVLDLASSVEALGDLLVVSLDELDKVVVVNVLVRELKLADKARIGLAEHSVTISWNDLTRLESDIDELTNILTSPAITVLLLEGKEVIQALLVGETVKGSGQAVHASGE